MTLPAFKIGLAEPDRRTLEAERARLGLRSQAEVIRWWIGRARELQANGGVPMKEGS